MAESNNWAVRNTPAAGAPTGGRAGQAVFQVATHPNTIGRVRPGVDLSCAWHSEG